MSFPIFKNQEVLESLWKVYFISEEIDELCTKHGRTTAGFVALKKALCTLFQSFPSHLALTPKDFVIGHDEKGAPIVRQLPKSFGQYQTFVSISHTRKHAYGLALYSGELP